MKKIYRTLFTLILIAAMTLTSSVGVSALTTEGLNNLTTDDGSVRHKVDETNAIGKFTVNVYDSNTDITAYRIVTLDLSQDNPSPEWATPVKTWLGITGGDRGKNYYDKAPAQYDVYTTPSLLGAATETIQSEFIKSLFGASEISGYSDASSKDTVLSAFLADLERITYASPSPTISANFAEATTAGTTITSEAAKERVTLTYDLLGISGADDDEKAFNAAAASDDTEYIISVQNDARETIYSATLVKKTGYRDSKGSYYRAGENYTYTDTNGSSHTTAIMGTETEAELSNIGLTKATFYWNRSDTTKRYAIDDQLQAATNGSFLFEKVPVGEYVILASAGSNEYAPLSVSLIPDRDGAQGNWYLSDTLSYSLKAAQLNMVKKINGKDADTVYIGEDVDFSVVFNIPTYAERRQELSSSIENANGVQTYYQYSNSISKYTLTFDDELSNAFTLDPYSVTVEYRTTNPGNDNDDNPDNDGWTPLDGRYYAALIASPAATSNDFGTTVWGCSVSHLDMYTIYANKYKYYIADSIEAYNSSLAGTYGSLPAGFPDSGYTGTLTTSDNTVYPYYRTSKTDANGVYYSVYYDPTNGKVFLVYYEYYYNRDGAYHRLSNQTYNKSYPQYYGASSNINCLVTPSQTNLATASNGSSMIRALYSAETKDTIPHGWTSFPASQYPQFSVNIFNISFDYDELLDHDYNGKKKGEDDTNDNIIAASTQFRVLYHAQVNSNIAVGAETNTNYVVMKYETNAAGTTFNTIEDTVNAYTYAINVVKMDGETKDEANPTYLAGAVFKLYREADRFTGTGEEATWSSEVGGDKSVWEKSVSGTGETLTTSYSLKYTKAGSDTETELTGTKTGSASLVTTVTLKDYLAALDAKNIQYYLYEDGGNTRVFILYTWKDSLNQVFDGTITSVGTSGGVTHKGLDVGNYILSETTHPTGYNQLAEDIYFEINGLNQDYASEVYSGSYAGFLKASTYVSQEQASGGELIATTSENTIRNGTDNYTKTDYVANGVYPLTVLNYKGITLPSTGGMGTTLFTILGILIMLGVMIVVLAKRKKTAAFSLLLVGLLTVSVGTQKVYAVTTITMSDKYGTKVEGDGYLDFTVELKNQGDTIEVYKIAELKWNSTGKTFEGPAWVLAIGDQIKTNDTYKAYSTPELLGEAPYSVQTDFLEWLYEGYLKTYGSTQGLNKSSAAVLDAGGMSYTVKNVEYGIYLIKATGTEKSYQILTVDAMPTEEGPEGNWYLNTITASLKFSDISVEKTINDKAYDTVKEGETVTFTLQGEVPDYPKLEENILRDVNGNPVDEEGNIVSDPANYVYDYSKFYFAVVDTMSEGFTLDASTIRLYYTDGTKEALDDTKYVWTDLEKTNYTMLFADAAASASSLTGIVSYADATGTNYLYAQYVSTESGTYELTWYAYDRDKGTVTKVYTQAAVTSANYPGTVTTTELLTNYNQVMNTSVTSFTRQAQANWSSIYNVTYDYEKLLELGAKYVKVEYSATVNENAEVGNDNNTNTASFYYTKNIAGEPDFRDSTVYAWTYAARVVKQNGDNPGNYLAGAKFKLYKENYTYVPSEAAGNTSDDYGKYQFAHDIDGSTTAPQGQQPGAGSATDLTTLANMNSVVASDPLGDTYFRIVSYSATDVCTETGCYAHGTDSDSDGVIDTTSGKEHIHYVVYPLYKDEFTSVATQDGVVISGLEPSKYVLIETEAPTGYNKLNEAIIFEINEITMEQAKSLYDAESKKGFVSDQAVDEIYSPTEEQINQAAGDTREEKTKNAIAKLAAADGYVVGDDGKIYKPYVDGIYPITVNNYSGLTLPSTGGMGTRLFTILGFGIMAFVMILLIILAKKRKENY